MNKVALLATAAIAGLACAPAEAVLTFAISADYSGPWYPENGPDPHGDLPLNVSSTFEITGGSRAAGSTVTYYSGTVTSLNFAGTEYVTSSTRGIISLLVDTGPAAFVAFDLSSFGTLDYMFTIISWRPSPGTVVDLASPAFYASPPSGGLTDPYNAYGTISNVRLTVSGTVPDVFIAPPAPEPVSWAMMLAGFGMIGGAMRTRRKTFVSFA